MRKIPFFLTLLLLSSCVGKKSALNWMLDHPGELAKLCSTNFPVIEKIIPGTPLIKSTVTPGPMIPCPPSGAVKCPDSRNVENLIRDTIIRVDSAKLRVAQDKLANEHDLRIKAETRYSDLNDSYRDLKKDCRFNTILVAVLTAVSIVLLTLLLKK